MVQNPPIRYQNDVYNQIALHRKLERLLREPAIISEHVSMREMLVIMTLAWKVADAGDNICQNLALTVLYVPCSLDRGLSRSLERGQTMAIVESHPRQAKRQPPLQMAHKSVLHIVVLQNRVLLVIQGSPLKPGVWQTKAIDVSTPV